MGNVYIESFGLKFALDGGNEGKRKLGSRHLTLLLEEISMHNGAKVFLKSDLETFLAVRQWRDSSYCYTLEKWSLSSFAFYSF